MAELEEVIVKASLFDVHDVVLDGHELIDGRLELVVDLHHSGGKDSTLSVTDLNLLEALELEEGARQVEHVLAALLEAVEADEQSVLSDFPLATDLGLVLMVALLELGTSVKSNEEFRVGFTGLVVLDEREDLLAINEVAASVDHSVADLADEHDEAGGRVVVLRVSPDKEDRVHDGHEQLSDVAQLLGVVGQLVEEIGQGLQVEVVIVGLDTGSLDLLLELGEGTSVGTLVLLEELEHLLDALATELLADVVEVVRLVLPEGELDERIGVLAALEGALRILLQHILDLLGPVGNGLLEETTLVLARRFLRGGDIVRREWQLRAALDLTNGDVGVSQEDMELVHEILGNELRHVHDVEGVSEDREVDLVTEQVEVLERLLVELHEDDFALNIVLVNVHLLALSGLADTETKEDLLLDLLGSWRLKLELEGLSASGDCEEE